MTAYNRLHGTYCSENHWLISELLRGEWGFDGVVVSDWNGTHSGVESLLAGLDIEMPGPTRHRGDALVHAHAAGAIKDVDIDASVARIEALAEWCAASSTGTDEITADDAETRSVCRRAAAAGMVLLKNDDGVLPLGPPTRIALIGPYADTGRVQGGGSARVRAERPAPILPALRARGFAVDFERGGTIHKTIPAVRGDFDLTVTDVNGVTHRSTRTRIDFGWQQVPAPGLDREFGATLTGTFVPDASGDWTFGFRVIGRATVTVDGEVTFDVVEPATGGSFFSYGGPGTARDRPARSGGAVPDRHRVPARAPPRLARVRVGRRATCDGRSDRRRRAAGGRGRRRARRRRARTTSGRPRARIGRRWTCPAARTSSSPRSRP